MVMGLGKVEYKQIKFPYFSLRLPSVNPKPGSDKYKDNSFHIFDDKCVLFAFKKIFDFYYMIFSSFTTNAFSTLLTSRHHALVIPREASPILAHESTRARYENLYSRHPIIYRDPLSEVSAFNVFA